MRLSARLILSTGLAVLSLFFGCAPSSSSARYGSKNEESSRSVGYKITRTDTLRIISKNAKKIVSDSLQTDTDDDGDVPYSRKYDLMSSFPDASKGKTLGLNANFADIVESMKMAIVKYEATPYVYGGNDLDGIDCSAFTQNVYKQAFSINLPRTAREQFQIGEMVNREYLKFGDLIFFNTRRRVRPGHVAIYIGDNKFVHASSHNGVVVSSLDEDYYNRKYMGARRIVNLDNFQTAN
ncbi:MAG: C40 family peptidase [Ignavibacteria bacterium]|nr:C40 family peptidase [Ignavibacteria bacterium]